MFDWFFKKKDDLQLHVILMQNVFNHLDADFDYIRRQLAEDTFIRCVKPGKRGYISFRRNPDLLRQYEQRKGRHLTLRGIYVFDELANEYVELQIEISEGVLSGYFAVGRPKIKPVVDNIRMENYRIEYPANDYKQIAHLLTPEEKDLLNLDEVYEVELDGKVYYHLCELGDGDFIGIDGKKTVYFITHDPYEITPQQGSLQEILKRQEEQQ